MIIGFSRLFNYDLHPPQVNPEPKMNFLSKTKIKEHKILLNQILNLNHTLVSMKDNYSPCLPKKTLKNQPMNSLIMSNNKKNYFVNEYKRIEEAFIHTFFQYKYDLFNISDFCSRSIYSLKMVLSNLSNQFLFKEYIMQKLNSKEGISNLIFNLN